MSHFTVLVIGEDVERQLAPFHEFECTGVDDEYVQDVDVTQKLRAEFLGSTRQMAVNQATGERIPAYDDFFYRLPTPAEAQRFGAFRLDAFGSADGLRYYTKDWNDGREPHARVHDIPSGWKQVEVPLPEVTTFRDWLESDGTSVLAANEEPLLHDRGPHKYGYARLDEAGEVAAVIRRTNPNKKWDWWLVGGRWAGFFRMKTDAVTSGAECVVGTPGLFTEEARPGRADSARKGDIDFDAMRDEAGEKARKQWQEAHRLTSGLRWTPWEAVREAHEGRIDEAREAYRKQPAVAALQSLLVWDPDQFLATEDEYVANARAKATSTHAVLKDGVWYERGEMGWWGVVLDEKDDGTWRREHAALLDSLSDDTLLTVVDCHI